MRGSRLESQYGVGRNAGPRAERQRPGSRLLIRDVPQQTWLADPPSKVHKTGHMCPNLHALPCRRTTHASRVQCPECMCESARRPTWSPVDPSLPGRLPSPVRYTPRRMCESTLWQCGLQLSARRQLTLCVIVLWPLRQVLRTAKTRGQPVRQSVRQTCPIALRFQSWSLSDSPLASQLA